MTAGVRGDVARLSGLVVMSVLLMGACGSDDDSVEATTTVGSTSSAAAATTTEPSTTTTLPTTTAPSTTTSTLPPWANLADPGMPPPHLGGQSEASIESMCLEFATSGSAGADEESVVEGLTRGLRFLGMKVVSEGCEATLSLSITGRRSSATYQEVGVCWSGFTITGTTALIIDDRTQATWRFNASQSPPFFSRGCPTEDQPIWWGYFGEKAWHAPFFEMYGNLGNYVSFDLFYHNEWAEEHCWEGSRPPTDDELRGLASLLARQSPVLEEWMLTCLPADHLAAFVPLVPYLIAGDDPDRSDDSDERLLEWITGASSSSPAEWWTWWETHQG